MSLSKRRALCGILLAGSLTAGTAVATEPGDGSVSKAAPKVTWKGETTGGYLTRMPTAVSGSEDTPCEAPSCESFSLKVADSANLTIAEALGTDSETGAVTLRVIQPDGSVVQADSDPGAASGGKYFKVVIKNAKTGDYTIHHYDNAADGMTFDAYAELAVPPAPVSAPAPVATPAPAGQTVEALSVAVKTGKASAKKLNKAKKLAASVTVSRAVTSITAALKKGTAIIGTGSRGATSGTAKIALKLKKKLKKGTYSLTVSANDGTTAITKTVKVKVAK